MKRLQRVWTLGIVAFAVSAVWAQDNPAPAQDSSPQQPVAAYGQENAPAPISENPPLSGLDQPNLEPHAAPLSYLQPGGTVSESADSNIENGLGKGTLESISRALASLTLQRLWSHYDLAMQYEGGVAYYNLKGIGWKLMQQMDLDQKITWKRGQLSLRDSFSYLPEGNFGAAYGSLGSQGIASVGNTAFGQFWGGSSFGTLGLVPRIENLSLVDVEQNLTPKSAITAAGGYAFTHFYGSDPLTGVSYLGNTQISGQFGYNRLLTPHTQIAMVYGYQGFDFSSVGTAFHSHVIQGMVGHRITGRMDFLVGAGPQITNISFPGIVCSNPSLGDGLGCIIGGGQLVPTTEHDRRLGVAGQVRFRYRFPRTSLDLTYQRFDTSGSGIFAGARSDVVRFTAQRPLSRVYTAALDLGYSHNSRIGPLPQQALQTCGGPNQPVCPGVSANTYTYGFVGVVLHRSFGREFHGFASYQFNELAFDNSFCAPGLPACSRIGQRHVVTIGLDWTPRPIRID